MGKLQPQKQLLAKPNLNGAVPRSAHIWEQAGQHAQRGSRLRRETVADHEWFPPLNRTTNKTRCCKPVLFYNTYCFASVLRIEEEDVLVLFVLCDCCRCLRVDQESVDDVIVWKVERGGKSRGRLKKGGARKGMFTNKQGLCSLRRQCTSTFGMFCIPGSVSHVVRWASRSPRLTSTERMPTTPKPVLADAAAQRKTKNQSTTACSAARGQCLGASMPPSLSSETHNFMEADTVNFSHYEGPTEMRCDSCVRRVGALDYAGRHAHKRRREDVLCSRRVRRRLHSIHTTQEVGRVLET